MQSFHIKEFKVVVVVAYRSPNTNQCQSEDIINKLHHTLETLPTPGTEFLLLRGFNFPHVNWELLEMDGGTAEEK